MISRTLRVGAVISNISMWAAAATTHGALAQAQLDPSRDIRHDAIYVSLPIFLVSLFATAGFTWTVAKYDSKRARRLERLELKIAAMLEAQAKAQGTTPDKLGEQH